MHFYQPLVQRPQAGPPLGGRDDFYLAAEARIEEAFHRMDKYVFNTK